MPGAGITAPAARGRTVALVPVAVPGMSVAAAARDTGEPASRDEVQAEVAAAFEAVGDCAAAQRDEALEVIAATRRRPG